MDTFSSSKTREDLLKTINSYFDIKENCKYIIYFNESNQDDSSSLSAVKDIILAITNGINVWSINITNEAFISDVIRDQLQSKTSLYEFLSNLDQYLKRDEFELNKIIDTENLVDLIQFESKATLSTNNKRSAVSVKFMLKPVKSSANEIKDLMFLMFNKMNKCELELHKLSSKVGSVTNNGTADLNSAKSSTNKQTAGYNHQPRRFNLSKQQVANVISPRKPYMSIINPLTKRRKTPKGVQFDDDDDDEDSNHSNSDSEVVVDNKVKN